MGLEQQLSADLFDALFWGSNMPLPQSATNPFSTRSFGTSKTYLSVTEWDQNAVPTNWTQTLNGSGAVVAAPTPLAGTNGVYQMTSGITAAGRGGQKYSAGAGNFLNSFIGANYTSVIAKINTTALPGLTQKTLTYVVVAGVFAVNDVVVNASGLGTGTILAINVVGTTITLGSITGAFSPGDTITSGAKSGTIAAGGVQNGYNSVFQMGWIAGTTAAQVAGASGNTLALMYDPNNNSGYNPGLIQNLFILARSVSGQVTTGVTANTVFDLGVGLTTGAYDVYELLYDNILGQIRAYKNNVQIGGNMTDLSNVPGGPTRGLTITTNGLSPTWYVGNSATVSLGTTGITQIIDKFITYIVYP
jgi:hypothetical protein